MSNTISQQLASLFDEWRKRLKKNGDGENFTEDGVMFQNGIENEVTEQHWISSTKRVLFLLKDQNESNEAVNRGGCDTRYFLKDTDWTPNAAKVRNLDIPFYEKIAYMLWGLLKADKDNSWQFDDVTAHHEEVKEMFCTHPFAVVECKKISGGGSCDDKELKHHIKTYGDLLKEEIEILNPNIIVCTDDFMYNYVCSHIYPTAKLVVPNDVHFQRIKYVEPTDNQQDGIVILRAFHPGAYGKNDLRATYESAMYLYRAFLQSK